MHIRTLIKHDTYLFDSNFCLFSIFPFPQIFTSSQSADGRKMAAAKKKAEAGGTSKALVPVPEGAIRKQQHHPKGLHPILAAVSKRIVATLLQYQQPQKGSGSILTQASPAPTPRMSRSATRTRMLLCADDKTISKVKIL